MAKFPLYALSGYNKALGIFYELFVAGKAMGIYMNINFGENLKVLRTQKALTQEKLAEYLGVTFQSVSKWERGVSQS